MTTHQQSPSLSEIAGKPTFRTIDGLSVRFVESDRRGPDALLLSPWPESVFAYEATWSRLAERGVCPGPGTLSTDRWTPDANA
jgi:hypothetical protein